MGLNENPTPSEIEALRRLDPYTATTEELALLNPAPVKVNYYNSNRAKFELDLRAYLDKHDAFQHDVEDIPEPEIHRSDGDAVLDGVLTGIDVMTAYNTWIHKSTPDPRGKTSNIMVSCPIPGHPDKDPSADLNLDKGEGGVWHCHACQIGGDKYDLAAIGLGYAWPDAYKTDGSFPALRREMAERFGYIVKREHGKTTVTEVETVVEDDPAPVVEPADTSDSRSDDESHEGSTPSGGTILPFKPPADPLLVLGPDAGGADPLFEPLPEPVPTEADVVTLRPEVDHIGVFDASKANLEWREIIPEDTFLWEYMEQNCFYEIPHEYHFWIALQLIAMANGYHMRLEDVPLVSGNLFVVLVGPTGAGKSRAARPMKQLMQRVFPWTGDADNPGTGVKVLGGVESGQALIQYSNHFYTDPAAVVPGTQIQQPNVIAWTMPEEFAGFVKKAMRTGSDFKERAIEFFDCDMDAVISTTSRSGGEITALGPFLQITSTTQPEAIHTYLSAEDTMSGFLNRFIFVSGESRDERPAQWLPKHAPDLTRAEAGLRAIMKFAESHDGLEIPYTDDGIAAWEILFKRVEFAKVGTGPMAVRLDLILKKIMLLFALNEHKVAINADLVKRMTPILEHLLVNYTRITGELYWRADDDCQNAILVYVTKKNESGGHPSKKEITDAIKRPMQGRSRFDIMRALDVLEKLDMIQPVKIMRKGATGPHKTGYKLGGAAGGLTI